MDHVGARGDGGLDYMGDNLIKGNDYRRRADDCKGVSRLAISTRC